MSIPALLVAAGGLLGQPVPGLDASTSAGLVLNIDPVPEPMQVDGVWITVQRVTGADVPALARRIESQWRMQGSAVRVLQHGSWSMRTRLQGRHAEVIQWRGNGPGAELLLSAVDLQRSAEAVPDPGFALPAGCSWVRSVSGTSVEQRFLQRSARCALPVTELAAALRQSLATQGWRVRSADDAGLLIDRPGAAGVVSLAAIPGDAKAWLVWLRVDHALRGAP